MRTENMTQQNAIQIFEGNQVRVAWNEEEEKYYFSIVDVVQILTEQPTPRKASTYWKSPASVGRIVRKTDR